MDLALVLAGLLIAIVWSIVGRWVTSALFGNRIRKIRTLVVLTGLVIGLLVYGYHNCNNAEFIKPIVVSTLACLGLLLATLGILFACTNPEKVRRAVSFPIWKYGLFISFLMAIAGIVFSFVN